MQLGHSDKKFQDLTPVQQVAKRMRDTEMTDDKAVELRNGDVILTVDQKELLLLMNMMLEKLVDTTERIALALELRNREGK